MQSQIINIITSLTNLYGIAAFSSCQSHLDKAVIANCILASSLMHLSERKHGLVGIYPFNKFSTFFLNYDRVSSSSLVIYTILTKDVTFVFHTLYPYIGMLSLFLSEKVCVNNKLFFTVTHNIWHIAAFHCLYLIYH